MSFVQLNQLPAELQLLASYQDLVAGQILFAQGELAESFFVVESGCIWLVNYTEDGQRINHYSVRAGESLAEIALFNQAYVCTAIASVSSRVLALPKQPFRVALRQQPDLAEALMVQLAKRLHESKILLELRSIRSAQKRVLHYLRSRLPSNEATVTLDRPLKEIADDLGLTPEALSRTLGQLQRAGVITRQQRKITFRKD